DFENRDGTSVHGNSMELEARPTAFVLRICHFLPFLSLVPASSEMLPRILLKAILILPALPLFSLSLSAAGALSMPSHFSDHAVLQRSPATALWGRGEPGAALTITLGPAKA